MQLMSILAACAFVLCVAALAQDAPFSEGCLLHKDFAETQEGAAMTSQFDTVSVPDLDLDDLVEELTLCAWIAPAERPLSYQTILYKGRRAGENDQQIHFFLSLFDGRPEFKYKDAQGVWKGIMRNGDEFPVPGGNPVPLSALKAVPALRWSHVAATFKRGEITLYLDGAPQLSGRVPDPNLVPNEFPLLIGEGQAQEGERAFMFIGLIDDVRIYSRALPAEELRGLYEMERAGKPEGALKIHKPLPEGYDPEFKTKLPLVEAYERTLAGKTGRVGPVETVVREHRGAPMLHINGKPVYGMAMMPEPYVSDAKITLSCRDFAAAGLNLYSEIFWSWMTPGEGCHGWWLGEGEYDFAKMDRRIQAIIAANPDALILPRLKLNPPNWWLEAHPDEITREADGKVGQQASLASELWADTYERMLRDVVRHMEAADYSGHIFGYHPAGGGSSEWFWWGESGRVDFAPAAVARWRKWLAGEYGGDAETLRRAWGDPQASFETAQPPSPKDHETRQHGVFRHPVQGRAVIDYRRFLSDMVSSNIIRSCRIVKEETGGRKIAGVFYGYSSYCTLTDGFQGLKEVLASPHVDFLAAPTAYDLRRGGQPGSFISAYTGSYRLHNKLMWDEVDTRTHLYPAQETYRVDTLPETLSVLERAAGYSLTRGTQLWWFLLAGNATFHHAEVMDDIARLREACEDSLDRDRKQRTEVAVFMDEDNMHVAPGDNSFRRALLRDPQDELLRMGAPFDTYLLSDIADPRLPEYKLYIFLNAFKLTPQLGAAMAARLARPGSTGAFVYAPGYVGEEGFRVEGIGDTTGIGVRELEGAVPAELTLTEEDHIITRSSRPHQGKWTLEPAFEVIDPDATILGTTAGKPSLAVKEQGGRRSVYSLLPLKRDVLAGLCRYAGVHVYSDSFDPFFANESYAMIHTAGAGAKRITLPRKAKVVELVTGGVVGDGIDVIQADLPAGVTRIYRLDPVE